MDTKPAHNKLDQFTTDEFLTIVIVSNDYEKIVGCNNSLDHSSECRYCVVAALTTKQGLSLSQAHRPNCIVVDARLTDDKFLNALSERFEDTPIIFITDENGDKLEDTLKTKGFVYSIALQNIDNDGLHNTIQLAVTKTNSVKADSDDIYNNQRKTIHYNSYSYAKSKHIAEHKTLKNQ